MRIADSVRADGIAFSLVVLFERDCDLSLRVVSRFQQHGNDGDVDQLGHCHVLENHHSGLGLVGFYHRRVQNRFDCVPAELVVIDAVQRPHWTVRALQLLGALALHSPLLLQHLQRVPHLCRPELRVHAVLQHVDRGKRRFPFNVRRHDFFRHSHGPCFRQTRPRRTYG